MNLGRWEIDDFLTFTCNTHDPETGEATDADAVPSYRVYEDETGTPILTGSMALLDSANTAGFYSERIQLTAANGFEVGKCYTIYISATVDSTEGTISHSFQVEAAIASAADLATVDANVDAILVDTGTTLPATLTTIEGKIDTVDTVVDAIKAVTDNLPDSGQLLDLAAILEDTGTTLPAQISALNDLSSADVQTVLENNDLDHLLKVAHPTGDPVVNSILDYIMNKDGSQTFDRTADSLEALGESSGATPADIADAVWDEAISGHVSAGTFGAKNQNLVPSETINDYKADVSGLATQASVDVIDGNVDLILADTSELQSDWTDGGRLDLILDAIKAVTDNLPDSGALTSLATQASVDVIDGNVDLILADTNELQTDWTDGGRLDLILDAIKAVTDNLPDAGALTTIDSNIDAILVDTGTTIPGTLATLASQASVDTVDGVVDAIKAKTDNLPADPAATSDITALNDLSSADVQTVLENNDLDHLAKVAHPTGIPTADSLFDLAFSKDAGQNFNRATDSLEALRDENYEGPTLSQIVDGVWDELASGHVTAGSFGDKLQNKIPSATIADYRADVSALATAAALSAVDGKIDTIDTVVDAIKAVTDLLPDGGALTTIDGNVDAILVDTDTTIPNLIAALNDLSSADIQTVIETNDLDHLAKVAHPSGDPVADTLFDLIMNKDGSQTFDRSTDALEAISEAGGGSTPAAIADAVWDEAIGDHTGSTTFGGKNQNLVPSETINDYKADVSALATAAALAIVDGKVDTVDTVVDAIKAVTDNLPDSGSLLDLAAIKAVTDNLPESGALTTIDGNIDAIKAVTDLLPDAGALTTIDANIDAILVDTGTTLPAQIAAIDTLTPAEVEDAVWEAAIASHTTSGTFGLNILTDIANMDSKVDAVLLDTTDLLADVADLDLGQDDLSSEHDDILADTALILAAVGGGPPAGAITFVYNVTNTVSGQPIADADVWVTTDIAGNNVIASGKTDQFGNVTFYLDAGTVYLWRQKSGFNFDNPDTEVVS